MICAKTVEELEQEYAAWVKNEEDEHDKVVNVFRDCVATQLKNMHLPLLHQRYLRPIYQGSRKGCIDCECAQTIVKDEIRRDLALAAHYSRSAEIRAQSLTSSGARP